MSDQQNVNKTEYIPEKPAEDVPIDLTVILGHVLIRWKIVLIAALVCAVIGGVIGGANNVSQRKEAAAADPALTTEPTPVPTPTPVPSLDTLIEQAASALTDEQKAEADGYYSQMLDYEHIIEEQKKAIADSYIMNLDPDAAVKYRMLYYLETDLNDAGTAYNIYIMSEDDYRQIGDVLGPEHGMLGFNEVLSIGTSYSDPSYTMDLERTEQLTGEIDNEHKTILTVWFYSPDEEKCADIAKIVDNAVQRRTKSLIAKGASVKATLFDESVDISPQIDIANRQKDKTNLLVGLINGEPGYINNILAVADPVERTYLDRLRGIMPEEPKEEQKEEPKKDQDEVEVPLPLWESIASSVLIGFFTGMILSILCIVIRRNTDGKLHSSKELTGFVRLPVLQRLSANTKLLPRDTIAKKGYSLLGYDTDETAIISALIGELDDKMQKMGTDRLYIAAERSSEASLSYAKTISEGSNAGATCIQGGMAPSAEEMKSLLSSSAVIMLPVFDQTGTDCIRSFVELCRRNGICIIGSAPVRDLKV